MRKTKIFIGLICFWLGFLFSYSLFPNTLLFKHIQAVYQDKVLVSRLSISIIDDVKPESEIINVIKQDKDSVKIDYQASDTGLGINEVQLWQRDLDTDWQLVETSSQDNGNFQLNDLADNVYQWITIAVDKDGNRQTENIEQLAQEQFNNWQLTTVQIDTQSPALAFTIPNYQPLNTLHPNFNLSNQGEEQINLNVAQADSYLVFTYQLETQATAEIVKFQVLIDGKVVYVDGAGEKDGWIKSSGWNQITYPLNEKQGEIEILFRLINHENSSYIPNLDVKDINIVEDKAQFNGLNIYLSAHDLGSGIKSISTQAKIDLNEIENTLFTAKDYANNITSF
jgi:hypothetical protein